MPPVQLCPPDEVLRAWLLGTARDPDAVAVGEHLIACPHCGPRLDRLVAADPLLADARAAAGTNSAADDGTLADEIIRRVQSPPGQSTPNAELAFLGLPLPEHPADLGTLGGRYRVVELLGQGGMGMVFRSVDTNLKRTVALKVILPKYAANEKLRARFLEEGQATAGVRSAHVAEVYDCAVLDGVPFLTMELLVGVTLDKKPKPMPVEQWRRVGYGIAKGLADAHRMGLIHRDLKPSNIHLGTDARTGKPTVKIIDFGLARPVDRAVEVTRSGELLGTPAYMSPEQARARKVDHRTDLYSLGVILYQLATGRLPYSNAHDGVFALLTELASADPLPGVRTVASDLPTDLAGLIDRLLAKDPAARPASADEVLAALKASLAAPAKPAAAKELSAEPVSLFAPSLTDADAVPAPRAAETAPFEAIADEPAPKPVRRRRAWPLAVAGLVAVALVGVLASGVLRVKTPTGTIVLTDLPDDAEVLVDGSAVKFKWDDGKQTAEVVGVKPGGREVEVHVGGVKVWGSKVSVATGPGKAIKVEWKDDGDDPGEAPKAAAATAAKPAAAKSAVTVSEELLTNGDCGEPNLKGWEIVKGKWFQKGAERDPFFCAGNCKEGVLRQDVDVSRFAADIDAGRVEFKVSAKFSSFDADRSQLKLFFLDRDKTERTVAYDSGEHAEKNRWVEYGGTAKPPAGTRHVRVVLRSVMAPRPGNVECSGYVDDVSLRALVTAAPATPAGPAFAAPAGSPLRYFGFDILGDGPHVGRAFAAGNFFLDACWRTPGGEAVLAAARQAKVRLLLDFTGISPAQVAKMYATIDKYPDVVAGVSWLSAYANGNAPEAVAAFARQFKQKYPGLKFWVTFVEEPRGKLGANPVPPEVDGLQVLLLGDSTPDLVRAKADRVVPYFLEKAKGRPVVLAWDSEDFGPGLVPRTQAGTMAAVVEAAKKHKLAGVQFMYLGEMQGYPSQGLQTNPALLAEVEAAAKELGIGRSNVPQFAAAPPGSPLRYFGYSLLGDGPHVGRGLATGNFHLDACWRTPGGEAVLIAARQAKVPLLLDFTGTAPDHLEKLYATIDKYRDVVAGVSWNSAYFNGHTADAVAAFGRAFKAKYPGLQFWLSCVDRPRGQPEAQPIPPEVDGVQVVLYYETTADLVRAKADANVPNYVEKAKGRPVVLAWSCFDNNAPGLVPRTQPAALRAVVEMAQKYKLAGVQFAHLGEQAGWHVQGLQTNPALVAEVEAAARELGFGRPAVDRNKFTVRGGTWAVVGDELAQTDAGVHYAGIEFGDPTWTDYDFRADVKRVAGNDQVALLYRWAGPADFNVFGIGTARNTFGVVEWQQAGKMGFLKSLNHRAQNDEWYTMLVKVRGD